MLSPASARFEVPGFSSGPDTISEITSPADLPKKGERVSKTKFAQPRKRLRTLTRSAVTRTSPTKPILATTSSSCAVIQSGTGPDINGLPLVSETGTVWPLATIVACALSKVTDFAGPSISTVKVPSGFLITQSGFGFSPSAEKRGYFGVISGWSRRNSGCRS